MDNNELKRRIANLKKSKEDFKERKRLEEELWHLEHPFLSWMGGGIKSSTKKLGKHLDEATK